MIGKIIIDDAANDLIIRSGGKWVEEGGQKVPQAPEGFDLENPPKE